MLRMKLVPQSPARVQCHFLTIDACAEATFGTFCLSSSELNLTLLQGTITYTAVNLGVSVDIISKYMSKHSHNINHRECH